MITDNFNRANGALGANWGPPVNSANYVAPTIVSNAVKQGVNHDAIEAYWFPQVFVADQYAQIKVTTKPPWGDAVWLLLRIVNVTQGAASLYVCNCTFPETGNICDFTIYKDVAGTYTNLGTATAAVANGDTLGARASGGTLSMQVNGVTVLTVTDPTPHGAGYVGFGMRNGATQNAVLDDFEGGASVATSITIPRSGNQFLCGTAITGTGHICGEGGDYYTDYPVVLDGGLGTLLLSANIVIALSPDGGVLELDGGDEVVVNPVLMPSDCVDFIPAPTEFVEA